MTKIYTQAPLPFQGQKRRWNNEFKNALKQFDCCNVFVDLFGGSGLLSRMVKDVRPDAVTIYNDFDNFRCRIDNIPRTNALLSELRDVLRSYPRGKIIKEPYRTAIINRIKAEGVTGFVDYITLSASLLFSMSYATSICDMEKENLYNTIRLRDYDATGYLDGLEVVRYDYHELFEYWRHFPNVCFLVDPPYLFTNAETYHSYWKLKDYLDVLHTLRDTNYFYFTSDKSCIVELCDWLEQNGSTISPFHGAVRKEKQSHMNYNSGYIDIMMYKRRTANE